MTDDDVARDDQRFIIGETAEQVEYREALKLWIQWAQFRRQGLLFVTAAEAGVLTASASSIALTHVPALALPAMGMFFAVIGLANEIFLFDEMMNFKRRAFALETDLHFSLLSAHRRSVHPLWLFLTRNIFRFYFVVWLLAFTYQLVHAYFWPKVA